MNDQNNFNQNQDQNDFVNNSFDAQANTDKGDHSPHWYGVAYQGDNGMPYMPDFFPKI